MGKLYADSNSPNEILTVNPTSEAAIVATNFTGVAMAGLAPTNPQMSNPGVALPDVVAGDICTTGFYIINTGPQTASYAINLFADSGVPLTLKFASGASSVLSGTLPPNGSAYFEASDPSDPVGGDLLPIQGLGGFGHLGVMFAAKLGFKTVTLPRGKDKEELGSQGRRGGLHRELDQLVILHDDRVRTAR